LIIRTSVGGSVWLSRLPKASLRNTPSLKQGMTTLIVGECSTGLPLL
jgi:hypothetical protein